MRAVVVAAPVARAAGADDLRLFPGPAAVLPLQSERVVAMYGAEKSLTPVAMDGGDWETVGSGGRGRGSAYLKHHGGYSAQPTSALGVLRNDRTPLNTPYTPQLVKLHLERHDEYEQQQLGDEHYEPHAAKQLIASLKTKLSALTKPMLKIRSVVDASVELVVPRAVLQSWLFANHRKWIVWYLTAVVSIPLAMLLSPLVIALCICTSPIWLAGVAVVVVRAVVPAGNRPPTPYARKASPHSRHHGRPRHCNGHHHHLGDDEGSSHPNSMYRHARISPRDAEQDG
ncbi:hypothetical protein PybrP1_005839 [[Pythium] brassicae (nom. inval.)]|nr:hypothetical protein PybrP1_005839 [[Pythium] brassicae (nom. inval.)]